MQEVYIAKDRSPVQVAGLPHSESAAAPAPPVGHPHDQPHPAAPAHRVCRHPGCCASLPPSTYTAAMLHCWWVAPCTGDYASKRCTWHLRLRSAAMRSRAGRSLASSVLSAALIWCGSDQCSDASSWKRASKLLCSSPALQCQSEPVEWRMQVIQQTVAALTRMTVRPLDQQPGRLPNIGRSVM